MATQNPNPQVLASSDSEFSSSVKKSLIRSYKDNHQVSLQSKKVGPAMQEYLNSQLEFETQRLNEFVKPVRFDIQFRDAVKEHHVNFVGLFGRAIELHNRYIAGTVTPNDAFDWFNNTELSEFRAEAISAFAAIGTSLSHKKRRLHPAEALEFIYKRVSTPLDQFCFTSDSKLDYLFEYAFDVLVQAFIEPFLKPCISTERNPFDFKAPFSINFNQLCSKPKHIQIWSEVMSLYNLGSYVLADSMVDAFSMELSVSPPLSAADRQSMLFDIFELIPLYIKSWSPVKNRIKINESVDLFFFLDYGIPTFVLGAPDESVASLTLSIDRFGWTVTGEFICFARYNSVNPNLKRIEESILPRLHELLMVLFAKRRSLPTSKSKVATEISSNASTAPEVFAERYLTILADHDHVTDTLPSTQDCAGQIRLPTMSMFKFFAFMATEFGCRYDNGKGSEMKIWKDGSHIYTLGRHGRDPKISSMLIRRILKRLDIDTNEWLNRLSIK